jgi:predicted O-linked N-acetylglucosamine transferase (SPINDLY family)
MSTDLDTISACWRQLRADPLQAAPWRALAHDYAARGLPWQAGYTARQTLRIDPSLRQDLDRLPPGVWIDAAGDGQLGLPALPQAARLGGLFLDAVAAAPGDWLSWLYLARLQDTAPDATRLAPLQAEQQAIALEPIAGESLHRLGLWRLNAGDHAGAVAALARLLDIRPIRHGSMMHLGQALLGTGQVGAAEKAFARAAQSDKPSFLVSLAHTVARHNGRRAALELLHKALTLQYNAYQLGDCRATLERIRAIDPQDPSLAQFEANLADRLGDARTYLAVQRAQCAASGDSLAPYACGLPMTALYDDTLTARQVAALHVDACAPLVAGGTTRPRTGFPNVRAPGRVLRVGWVSGDLHGAHPVELFLRPLLERMDGTGFEHIVYDTAPRKEDGTARPPTGSACWTRAATLDDQQLGHAIAGDGIDILIDLGGHTATRRLGLFARRAAPVQATFLGYPHSTGLSTIDWLIGDAVVSPAEHADLYSEGLAQLPGSVFCWAAPVEYRLPPARAADAPLVFGSFNNAMKISPRTVALWSELLRQVPDARLLLKAPSLGDPAVQARYLRLFGDCGIAADRLVLRGASDLAMMMQEYGDVDIALDPVPYNGGTTTLQALWMGVPVVTLAGANFVGRMGASFMQSLGRPEWVAQDDAGYVAAAVALARARGAVRAGRALLRERMRASPLADIDSYARHFEACLRAMWIAYCAGDGRRLLPAAEIARLARTAVDTGRI